MYETEALKNNGNSREENGNGLARGRGGRGAQNVGYSSGAQQKCEPDRADVERQPSQMTVHSTSVIPNTGARRTRSGNFLTFVLFIKLSYLTNLIHVSI